MISCRSREECAGDDHWQPISHFGHIEGRHEKQRPDKEKQDRSLSQSKLHLWRFVQKASHDANRPAAQGAKGLVVDAITTAQKLIAVCGGKEAAKQVIDNVTT